MTRLIIRLRDKTKVDELKQYGSIVYISPILNIAGLEILDSNAIFKLQNDANILSVQFEDEGSLLLSPV